MYTLNSPEIQQRQPEHRIDLMGPGSGLDPHPPWRACDLSASLVSCAWRGVPHKAAAWSKLNLHPRLTAILSKPRRPAALLVCSVVVKALRSLGIVSLPVCE
jgi:hypothetical protein